MVSHSQRLHLPTPTTQRTPLQQKLTLHTASHHFHSQSQSRPKILEASNEESPFINGWLDWSVCATSPSFYHTRTFSTFSLFASHAEGQASTLISKPRPTLRGTQTTALIPASHKTVSYLYARSPAFLLLHQASYLMVGSLHPCLHPQQSNMAVPLGTSSPLACSICNKMKQNTYTLQHNIIHQYIHVQIQTTINTKKSLS